jgi:hypothetical protein
MHYMVVKHVSHIKGGTHISYSRNSWTRITGPKSGEGFTMRNFTVYSSPNIISVIECRSLRWAGQIARMEEGRGVFKILTGKNTGKRPLGSPRPR